MLTEPKRTKSELISMAEWSLETVIKTQRADDLSKICDRVEAVRSRSRATRVGSGFDQRPPAAFCQVFIRAFWEHVHDTRKSGQAGSNRLPHLYKLQDAQGVLIPADHVCSKQGAPGNGLL